MSDPVLRVLRTTPNGQNREEPAFFPRNMEWVQSRDPPAGAPNAYILDTESCLEMQEKNRVGPKYVPQKLVAKLRGRRLS